ncbi:MAG: hypothetical protein ABSD27_05990 [Bryobacteraceae bacterium]|jgi:hypothetical protein
MPETLEKLRPDRDLQCYFLRPSGAAALSQAGPSGFVVSGCWRQQFDWAVLEWNRDNVFEHPAFRNLPDGDLSGLELTYEEVRTNCIPIDSNLYPTEWAYLRIWLEGDEQPRFVRLRDYATAIEGEYQAASAELELGGTPTAADYIGLAWLGEQYNYQLNSSDTVETAAAALTDAVNAFSTTVHAARSGARIVLSAIETGVNWNRVGVYGFVSGARTESWSPWWKRFSGGASPTKWRIELDFGSLVDVEQQAVPTTAVRKLRWTYAAGWQDQAYERSEFEVQVTNWAVSGANRGYLVAGRGSRRIEDDAGEVVYTGAWSTGKGNFSGGTIRWTTAAGARASCEYLAAGVHSLYLGTRQCDSGGRVAVSADGAAAVTHALRIPGEDVLARIGLGQYGAGRHTVSLEALDEGGAVYLDFLEVATPAAELPALEAEEKLSLATDWDTDHSICLAPERTAWMIDALGFRGRVNHYAGALWFYELTRKGHVYASGQIEFAGAPVFGGRTTLEIARVEAPDDKTVITHLHYIGDTAETVAKALELEVNRGCTSVRAETDGAALTIWARGMGADGNNITIAATVEGGGMTAQASGPTLAGGVDGEWITDVSATPRLNRAARDWHRSFFTALEARGLDATAALSMELQHGDASVEAGIAQRCPAGDPVLLATPALQTNFSPTSTVFWTQAYRDLAQVMAEAGLRPYLQFGEVQWWYFRDARSGMPYYDAYTQSAFHSQYGHDMAVITEHTVSPAEYPDEVAFLPTLIGAFTNAVMGYVRATYAACRFEVLYPPDVNETEFNRAVNYPVADWTPATLECLKTENFSYTYARNLDKCSNSIGEAARRGFAPHQSAHLVGISDPTTPWQKEARLARAEALESVVLFALDQLCLVGYPIPLPEGARRSWYEG